MPLDVQPVEPIEPLTRIGADRGFMGGDLLHPDPHHIVHRHTKPDLLDNAGCSGLKHHRRGIIGDLFAADVSDHITTAHEGPHFGHAFRFDVDGPRAAWAIKLMACDGIEITADILHVDRHMDRRL